MIHYLKIKNFYSIKEEQVINFAFEREHAKNNSYLKSTNEKDIISKLNLFVGSNASGKTNVLKAFGFIKWLICNSFDTKPDALLPYKTFFDNADSSMFEIRFEIASVIYTYRVEFLPNKILSERLESNSLVNIRRTDKLIFVRKYIESSKEYIFEDSDLEFTKSQGMVLKRQNTSVLAIGVQFVDSICMEVSDYWRKINANVSEIGYNNSPFEVLENLISFHLNPEEKNNVEKTLKRFDLGFKSLNIDSNQEGSNITINGAEEVHYFDGKERKNDLNYASNGTKRLLLVIRLVLFAIKSKTPLILDELEALLHPEILREILDMFIDSEVESQLIFTSHSLAIMNKLDQNQIFFAEKSIDNGSTEIFKLNDVDGVRADDNFYNKYIAGAYGAIPRI